MSVWHQREPEREENALWSRAGKVEVSQSCSWSCKEEPVPQGCLPVLPWDGNRKSPQFHSPNSKKSLFVIKEGLWLSWLSKSNFTVRGSAKSPETHTVAKAFCYSLSGPWDTPSILPQKMRWNVHDQQCLFWPFLSSLGVGAAALVLFGWFIYVQKEGGGRGRISMVTLTFSSCFGRKCTLNWHSKCISGSYLSVMLE